MTIRNRSGFVLLLTLLSCGSLLSADWPMWRFDAGRRGASEEELPENLHLQWVLELPAPKTAWPSNQVKLQFDRLYEPILVGKRFFVPSMVSDKLTAYSTETAEELWTFFAGGPIRFAPVAWRDLLYVVSDDGWLYCLKAVDGTVVWKLRGGPSNRRVLGNDRLTSAWPARGAPVVYDDKVYFGASIWPFMGVFLYALDAETGNIIWTNSGTGSDYLVQQHNSPAFAGVAPQGYLAATENHLIVAGGRTIPAVFDRHTGRVKHFNVSRRDMGSKGGGGYEAIAGENVYINRGCMYDLEDGKFLGNLDAMVIGKNSIIGKDDAGIRGFLAETVEVEVKDRRGNPAKKKVMKSVWSTSLDEKIQHVFIQSGSRLYCRGAEKRVVAVDLPRLDLGAKISWQADFPDEPLNMITGDGKLLVSTDKGRIYCFSGTEGDAKLKGVSNESDEDRYAPDLSFARDMWTGAAGNILRQSGVHSGYCVVLGLGSGRLVEELLSQSGLHVIVVESDAGKVDAFRRRMDARHVYGRRVAIIVGQPMDAELPEFIAELVVAEDPLSVGLGSGKSFVERVFHLLRPFTGVGCFVTTSEEYKRFERSASEAELDHGMTERYGELALLRRTDAPSGSADWTHQYADAANSVVSQDRRVKAPLGLLWFGGPSNEAVLPRHGHGPTPQVVGGQLMIEGRDILRAMDIYTGRVLWERTLKDVGKFYDNTSHEPGANLIGSNYVSLRDGIYVVHNDECVRLDPATGETISKFRLPASEDVSEPPPWGYIGIWKSTLIAGAQPENLVSPDYNARELRRIRGDTMKKMLEAIAKLVDFEQLPRSETESDSVYLRRSLNKLLADPDMVAKIPPRVRYKVDGEELEKKLEDYLKEVPGRQGADDQAMEVKRQLLHLYYQLPKFEKRPAGKFGSRLRVGSKKLVAMDRYTGKVLWEHEAKHQMRHNAIALGGGMVFYLDRLPEQKRAHFVRRGMPVEESANVTALDIRTGEVVWQNGKRVFGTWLGYSEGYDVLLQAGSRASDRALDEVGRGLTAYKGSTGEVIWENDSDYSGPCMLLGDAVITQGYRTSGFAFDILTGVKKTRVHPVSGIETDWLYKRNYGCNTGVGSPNLLTFRSAAAGYYDLAGDSGTGNFGGFRAGCTSNLIPAGGILNAPDYTRTCTCSYQNQASLGLVHQPEVEMWTFSALASDDQAVRHVGLNFGAPGDRRDPEGLLWLDVPSVGGSSPDLRIAVFPPDVDYVRHHTTRMEGGKLPWVGASSLHGEVELVMSLVPLGDFVVANEIAAGPTLSVNNGTTSLVVPRLDTVKPGAPINTSLWKGTHTGEFDARVEGHPWLATGSLTVEFWTRVDADIIYVDASEGGTEGQQGFVIDQRKLRVRYFVANENVNDNEPVVTIEAKDVIPNHKWVHVAFSYDADKGVGTLYADGKTVGTHDGPDGRRLWWDNPTPGLRLGKKVKGTNVLFDELRLTRGVVAPEAFFNFSEAHTVAVEAERLIGHWRMQPSFVATGTMPGTTYTVRLVFAETEGARPGDRIFDVSLQGKKVLERFDIVAAAGGPNRTVIREVNGVTVSDHLHIGLSAQSERAPLLSGVQIVATPAATAGD